MGMGNPPEVAVIASFIFYYLRGATRPPSLGPPPCDRLLCSPTRRYSTFCRIAFTSWSRDFAKSISLCSVLAEVF